jgi:uncharacterized RDD family membrane protein YckC
LIERSLVADRSQDGVRLHRAPAARGEVREAGDSLVIPFGPDGPWAGVGVRFWALVIDAAVVLCVLLVLAYVYLAAFGEAADGVRSTAAAVVGTTWFGFALVYHPAYWQVFGGTLGQMVLGLRVVSWPDGRSLGIRRVIARYIIFLVETVVVPLGFFAARKAASDPLKRAWHDEAVRSAVVLRP